MAKFFFAIVAVVASLALAESLVCNKCSFNVLGQCIGLTDNQTCSSNTSVCYTDKYSFAFQFASDYLYINSTGCRDTNALCTATVPGNVTSLFFNITTACCTTDRCNKIISGAPSTKVTFSAAVAGAVLASTWGSFM